MKLINQILIGCAVVSSLASLVSNVAQASSLVGRAEGVYPRVSGNLLLDYVYTYSSSSGASKNLYQKHANLLDVEGSLNFELNQNFSLNSTFMLRPFYKGRQYIHSVRIDDLYSRSRLKQDNSTYGVGLSELYLKFKTEDARVQLGKFNPEFGMAWNKLRPHGLYENYFTEEYRLMNKVGGSVAILFKGAELALSSFFEDNSLLSEVAFNDLGRNKTSYGGSGNTGGFDSYTATVKGMDLMGIPGLAYNFGIMRLAEGEGGGDQDSEKGYVAGLEKEFSVAQDTSIIVFGEWAKFERFGGKKLPGVNRFNDVRFATISTSLIYSNWFLNASWTSKDNSAIPDEEIQQISIGYVFNNFKISVSRAAVVERRYSGDSNYAKYDYDMTGAGISYQLFF